MNKRQEMILEGIGEMEISERDEFIRSVEISFDKNNEGE
jgi:hypothetical protein